MKKRDKCKIKVLFLKYPLHELNYVLGMHCPRASKNDALYIEV